MILDGFDGCTRRFRKFGQSLPFFVERVQVFVFMLVTGLTGVGQVRVFERIFGQQRDEYMAADIPGLRTLGNPRHVAADTVGKRMNRVRHVLVDLHVALKTLPGAGRVCL